MTDTTFYGKVACPSHELTPRPPLCFAKRGSKNSLILTLKPGIAANTLTPPQPLVPHSIRYLSPKGDLIRNSLAQSCSMAQY
jgi:hypothetical protein